MRDTTERLEEAISMRSRRKLATFTTAAAGAVGIRALARARRRARLKHAAEGIGDTIMPTEAAEMPPATPATVTDEAHAPGHQHLHWSAAEHREAAPPPVRERPFAKHRHGLRHPGRG